MMTQTAIVVTDELIPHITIPQGSGGKFRPGANFMKDFFSIQ